MQDKVCVLLSTFNGERFIGQQLDSIFSQTHQNIRLRVRDDGSKDNTVAILEKFSIQNKGMVIEKGENLGVQKSFFQLLERTDRADYFAFCDQDDIWKPTKIENALKNISKVDSVVPALYCSRVEYVDKNMKSLGISRGINKLGIGNALVENIAPGCSMVINSAARDLLLSRLPGRALMHDWWTYIVISAFGEVVFDDWPSLKYRQHENNAVGVSVGFIDEFCRRLKRFKYRDAFGCVSQAEEFLYRFEDALSDSSLDIIRKFVSSRENVASRLSYAIKKHVWRQRFLDDVILRWLIVLGRY